MLWQELMQKQNQVLATSVSFTSTFDIVEKILNLNTKVFGIMKTYQNINHSSWLIKLQMVQFSLLVFICIFQIFHSEHIKNNSLNETLFFSYVEKKSVFSHFSFLKLPKQFIDIRMKFIVHEQRWTKSP